MQKEKSIAKNVLEVRLIESESHGRRVYLPDPDSKIAMLVTKLTYRKTIPVRIVRLLRDCGVTVAIVHEE